MSEFDNSPDPTILREGATSRLLRVFASGPGVQTLDTFRAFLNDELVKEVESLKELTAPLDALDLVEMARRGESPLNLDEFNESEYQGSLALVEVLALVASARPVRAGVGRPNGSAAAFNWQGEQMGRVLEHASTLVDVMTALNATSVHDGDPLAAVTGGLQMNSLLVRGSQYAHMQELQLREIYGGSGIQAIMEQTLGFDIEDALAVFRAVNEHVRDAMQRQGDRFADVMNESHEAELSEATLRAAFSNLLISPASQTSFTIAEIAERGALESAKVAEVVEMFSRRFETRDTLAEIQQFAIGRNPLKGIAFLADGGTYALIHPGLSTGALAGAVEERLKSTKHWNRFSKARDSRAESGTLKVLTDLLDPGLARANLKYFAPGPDQAASDLNSRVAVDRLTSRLTECDALIVVGTVAFVVEVKAGMLTVPSRGGYGARVESDLMKTIGEGARQAHRARSLIEQNGGLWIEDGSWLDLSGILETHCLVVTLDELGVAALSTDDLEAAGLLIEGQSPWVVSLHDLRVVASVVQDPAEFLLYVRRREVPGFSRTFASIDELDLFMLFLAGQLFVEPDPELLAAKNPALGPPSSSDLRKYRSQSPTFVGTLTDDLDAWIYFQTGDRQLKADQPRMKANRFVRGLADVVLASGQGDAIAAAADLLETDGPAQNETKRYFAETTRKAKDDRSTHSAYLVTRGYWGTHAIAVMSRPPGIPLLAVQKHLLDYAHPKGHQVRSIRTACFVVDLKMNVESVQIVSGTWVEDPSMDVQIRARGYQPPDQKKRPIPPSARRPTKRLRKR